MKSQSRLPTCARRGSLLLLASLVHCGDGSGGDGKGDLAALDNAAPASRASQESASSSSTLPPLPPGAIGWSATPASTPNPATGAIVRAPTFSPPSGSDVVSMRLQNPTAAALAPRFISFGQTFVTGAVRPEASLVAVAVAAAGSAVAPIQMDVKSTNPDGSVRMAVLTLQQPSLAPSSYVEVRIARGTLSPIVDHGFSQLDKKALVVDLSFGSSNAAFHLDVNAAVEAALKGARPDRWLSGSLASQVRVEVPVRSSMRFVADVTSYVDGSWIVDAQFDNDVAMSASGGALQYDATLVSPVETKSFVGLTHHQYTQWRRVFDSAGKSAVNVQHDVAYRVKSGSILPYDLSLGVASSLLEDRANEMKSGDWTAPFAANGIMQNMGTTGGRADIGPVTQHNAAWVVSQDVRARDMALAQADAAASIPWHYWDGAHARWLNTDDYPQLWTDGRGGVGVPGDASSGGLTQQVSDATGWGVDTPHMPDLSYVAYLMTGTRYYLDQLNAQASFAEMSTWTALRNNFDEPSSGKTWKGLVVRDNQVRGSAWSIRQLQDAAYVGLDGSFEKTYFEKMVATNFQFLNLQSAALEAQQGEAYGYLMGTYGTSGHMAPWQQDFFLSAVAQAARQGSPDALTYLKWSTNFYVGRFQAHDGWNPRDGATYNLINSDAATPNEPYKTWSAIGNATVAGGASNGIDAWTSTSGGYYGQLAVMSLSLIYDITKSPDAQAAYRYLIDNQVSNCQPSDFQRDPTFSMTPPP